MKTKTIILVAAGIFSSLFVSGQDIMKPIIPQNTLKLVVKQAVAESKAYTDKAVKDGTADSVSTNDLKAVEDVANHARESTITNAANIVSLEANKADKSSIFNSSGLFETTYTGTSGTTAKIFNETDGGGVQVIDGTTGVKAAVAVHAGGADVGLYGQWYAINPNTKYGVRITLTDNNAYYTKTNTYQWTASDEIATLREINELRSALDAAIQRIQALENK